VSRRFAALTAGVLAAAAAAVTVPMLLLGGTSAGAISSPLHVTATVHIRPTPDTSRPPLGTVPQGASPVLHCFTYGQNINGVHVWFNISWAGHTGYYASFYDDSHYSSEAQLTAKYGIPKCGAPAPAPAPSTADRAGHVAINLGGGQMISTYDGRTRGIHTKAIASYDQRLYLGWVGI
jgi:hypothetical protein